MDRDRHVLLPSIVLDRASRTPLHQQVRNQIHQAIRSGTPDGARLPSTRVLARLLGVSRNTILVAYEDLAADGVIHGRQGAAMLVTGRTRGMSAFDPRRVMREARYPARTLFFVDSDGTPSYLTY